MNFARFLLFDFIIIILGLPLLLVLQGGKFKIPFLRTINSNEMLEQDLKDLPSLKKLLDLEVSARKDSSGIEFDSLLGLWRFVLVWKKGADTEDSISSSLLRLFSASLELSKDQSNEEALKFYIINSIQFGVLAIKFIGFGDLKGPQPLLPFYFERIELALGKSVLISRQLDIPDEKQRPFFALIAMEESEKWLAARGRGGGLALWMKD